MSLLKHTPVTTRVSAIENHLERTLAQLKQAHVKGMRLTWEPEGEITPQAIFDELGPAGGELLQHGATLVGFISALDPDWQPQPVPYEITVATDGSVTVGDPVSPAEESSPDPDSTGSGQ